jgi:hypothetical protein
MVVKRLPKMLQGGKTLIVSVPPQQKNSKANSKSDDKQKPNGKPAPPDTNGENKNI